MLPIELGSDSTDSDSTPPADRQLDLQSAMKIVSKAYSSRRDLLLAAWRVPEVYRACSLHCLGPKNPFLLKLVLILPVVQL